jgi:CBS domain-containing protein
MLVHDCMSHRPETVDADDTLQMAAERMRVLDVGALPVVALGRLVGMITDRDIVVRGTARGHDGDTPVRVVMSPGAVTILAHDDVRDAVLQMARQSVRRLVVLDRELQIAGILSVDDLALQGCDPQLIAAVLARAVVRREEELGGPLP